jgi:hypothetical protein
MGKNLKKLVPGEFLFLSCPACFSQTLRARECVLIPAFGTTFFKSRLLQLLLKKFASFVEKVIHLSYGKFKLFISTLNNITKAIFGFKFQV